MALRSFSLSLITLLTALSALGQTPASCVTGIVVPEHVRSGEAFEPIVTFPENWSTISLSVVNDDGRYASGASFNVVSPVVPDFTMRAPLFGRPDHLRMTVLAETIGGALCAAKAIVSVDPDSRMAARRHAAVIPVGGSVRNIRTRLLMRGTGSGRVFFRAAGRHGGDDTDPSIRYRFEEPMGSQPVIVFEDLAAAMGVQGIGSFDIVPDTVPGAAVRFPDLEVEIYSMTEQGRYRYGVAPLNPEQLFPRGAVHVIDIEARTAAGEERVNYGIRTFEDAITATVLVLGHGEPYEVVRTFAPRTFRQTGVNELVGSELPAGSQLRISYSFGAAAPYHVRVESGTGDAIVVVPWATTPFANVGPGFVLPPFQQP